MENKSQLIIYQTEKGETKLEVRLEKEYDRYHLKINNEIESDFDKAIKKIEAPKRKNKKGK